MSTPNATPPTGSNGGGGRTNAHSTCNHHTPIPGVARNRAERRRAARSAAATLTITPLPQYGAHVRHILVDCEHATTGVIVMDGVDPDGPTLADLDSRRLAILKHFTEEGCDCTREPRRRFGLKGGAA